MKIRKSLFAAVLAVICMLVVYWAMQENKPWVVPEGAKKLQNPLQPTESNLRAARALYKDECAQCHGESGKGDGPEATMHDPRPSDITDARHMNSITDGTIFYQISEGRRPMPGFKKRMTEDQRWQLVLFVRSLTQLTAAPAKPNPAAAPSAAATP